MDCNPGDFFQGSAELLLTVACARIRRLFQAVAPAMGDRLNGAFNESTRVSTRFSGCLLSSLSRIGGSGCAEV